MSGWEGVTKCPKPGSRNQCSEHQNKPALGCSDSALNLDPSTAPLTFILGCSWELGFAAALEQMPGRGTEDDKAQGGGVEAREATSLQESSFSPLFPSGSPS